jgi:hypothetical protein
MQWIGVLALIGLVVIAIKTIWPLILATFLVMALVWGMDTAHRKWTGRAYKPPRPTPAERRRRRMHRRRGDPENFLSDAQLRGRADAAFVQYLKEQQNGEPSPNAETEPGEPA